MLQRLVEIVFSRVSLNQQDVQMIEDAFEEITYPKNIIIESEGKVPKYLYFIVSGYLRLYFYRDGEQVTTHINCPPGFFTAYAHFVNGTISDENVECITDCELLRISKVKLDQLMRESEAMKQFSLKVFQEATLYNESRSRELATLNAEERYLKLMDNYPDMIRHVPLQYIASFLGMNPKSLSRIRKQLIR
ncbi:MAG: cyclic nucleotide-binding protein [Flammeovirgaceae bacterium]|mgnify:FL=1|nr:cyclic nucleotide-binding protein [Flammeovirgaceae bacterium]MBR10594.1 cyclic nucleotide-binding protein [Rickettsiales bacterium]HCX23176.1 Crp/Fnr family transcriptional regulator [Cytophagales bacterium]